MITDSIYTPRNVDYALEQGVTDPAELAEAYYLDLTVFLGEGPGQRESFDALLEYLDADAPGEIWHAHMIGFGLALASSPESRAVVESAASGFLMLPDPGACEADD